MKYKLIVARYYKVDFEFDEDTDLDLDRQIKDKIKRTVGMGAYDYELIEKTEVAE